MNYLAHAYFSFGNDELIVGNLLSDFVKGKSKYDYPEGIQKGITLHRDIDEFTDASEVTRRAKEIFRPVYRLYSGAFVDVVYDHFLAKDTNEFSAGSLFSFSQQVYSVIERYSEWMPERFARMFPYMKNQNWLYSYGEKEMIKNSFNGLVRRSAYLTESHSAFELFEQYYDELEGYYREFS
ncbi:MAG: ACP phosphodiesterase, partial [Bacteroidota bacterium]